MKKLADYITSAEWEKCIDFLRNGEEYARLDHNGRYAEVAIMSGGRYLLGDCEGVTTLTDNVVVAAYYVVTGDLIDR